MACSDKWPAVLEEHAYETYNEEKFSDLVFLCNDGPVYSCQSLFASLSPLLSGLFRTFQCCSCQGVDCSKRENIQIHLEMEQNLLLKILSLVHKGFVRLESSVEKNEVLEGLKMLEIDVNGANSINLARPTSLQIPKPNEELSMNNSVSKTVESSSLTCPFEGCDRSCESRQKLLLHLLMDHYEKYIMQDYGKDFEASQGDCVICDKKLPVNLTGYLKHIGVDHEIVLDYLDKDPSVTNTPLELYDGNINEQLKVTNTKTSEDRAEDSSQQNPVYLQTEMAKKISQIPVACNISACFDKHIVMHKIENLRKKLFDQKAIVQDQAQVIKDLETEKEKLLKKLKKSDNKNKTGKVKPNKGASVQDKTKKDENEKLPKLDKTATIDIETRRVLRTKLPAETVDTLLRREQNSLSTHEVTYLKKLFEGVENQPVGSIGTAVIKKAKVIYNKSKFNPRKLDLAARVNVEKIPVKDWNKFVARVSENCDQICVKIPKMYQTRTGRKRKRHHETTESVFLL